MTAGLREDEKEQILEITVQLSSVVPKPGDTLGYTSEFPSPLKLYSENRETI